MADKVYVTDDGQVVEFEVGCLFLRIHDDTLLKAPYLLSWVKLSYVGRDVAVVPSHLAEPFGHIIRRLDLSYNCIRSLTGLEAFSRLEELILDNNELTDVLEFPYMPNLHTLTLNKNKVTNLDSLLDQLNKSTPSLTYLSLLGNEACPDQLSSLEKDEEDYAKYRFYVLYRMPKLKFLDSSPVRPDERIEASQRGPFLRVIRPSLTDLEKMSKSEEENRSPYTPLPVSSMAREDAGAIFGKCRYIYYGRHSEGNRFIRNNDL